MTVYYSEANGKLELQVEIRNQLNRRAIELHSELAKILSGWIGKKVVKVTPYTFWVSALGKEIDAMAEQFLQGENCRYRLTFEFGSHYVWANLEIIFNDNYHTHYKKAAFNLCGLKNSFDLAEITSAPEFRTDYDLQDISLKIRELSDLQDRTRDLESELRHFTVH